MVKESKNMTAKDRMFIEEISELIGVSVNTIQRLAWRKKNNIPLMKMGNRLISYRPIFYKYLAEVQMRELLHLNYMPSPLQKKYPYWLQYPKSPYFFLPNQTKFLSSFFPN